MAAKKVCVCNLARVCYHNTPNLTRQVGNHKVPKVAKIIVIAKKKSCINSTSADPTLPHYPHGVGTQKCDFSSNKNKPKYA